MSNSFDELGAYEQYILILLQSSDCKKNSIISYPNVDDDKDDGMFTKNSYLRLYNYYYSFPR